MRTSILHKDVFDFLLKNGIDCEYIAEQDQIKILIQIEENSYELYMKFPQYYPYEFPEIYIKDTKNLHIPHRYSDDMLC